jgi:hypothetical protein
MTVEDLTRVLANQHLAYDAAASDDDDRGSCRSILTASRRVLDGQHGTDDAV